MQRIKIKELLKLEPNSVIGNDCLVKGWVRTRRESKNISFIALNDGSTINHLQIVVDHDKFNEDFLKKITTGSAIGVKGK